MLDTTTPGKFPADLRRAAYADLSPEEIIAEIMPAVHRLDDAALITLRRRIDDVIEDRAHEHRRQLAAIETARGAPPARPKGSPLRGIKVAPRYRGPNGETWAGRGAYPNWLAILIGQGRSRDEFLIRSEDR